MGLGFKTYHHGGKRIWLVKVPYPTCEKSAALERNFYTRKKMKMKKISRPSDNLQRPNRNRRLKK